MGLKKIHKEDWMCLSVCYSSHTYISLICMALIWCSNVVETCLYAGKLKEACQSIGFNKVRIQTDGLSDDFLSVFIPPVYYYISISLF